MRRTQNTRHLDREVDLTTDLAFQVTLPFPAWLADSPEFRQLFADRVADDVRETVLAASHKALADMVARRARLEAVLEVQP